MKGVNGQHAGSHVRKPVNRLCAPNPSNAKHSLAVLDTPNQGSDMFNSIRKSLFAHEATDADAADSAERRNLYVQSAMLKGPGGLSLVDEFWEPATLFKFASKSGLKQVVASAAYSNGSKLLVPHHVLVELPDETLAHDRRTGGHMVAEMAHTLGELHQRDFSHNLPEGAHASYRVVAASDLAPGTVRVRLGPAIYVPQPDDQAAWQVQLSVDGADWDALPPIHLHVDQRLFILSGSADHGSQTCPDWPFPAHVGLVLLNLPEEHQLDFSAEPLRSLEITRHPQGDWTVIRQPGSGPAAPCLYLRATRLSAPRQRMLQPLDRAFCREAVNAPAAMHVEPSLGGSKQLAGMDKQRVEPTLEQTLAPTQPEVAKPPVDTGGPEASLTIPLPSQVPQVQVSAEFFENEPGLRTALSPVPAHSPLMSADASLTADNAPTLMASLRPTQGRARETAPLRPDDAPTLMAVTPMLTARLALVGLALQRPSMFVADGAQGLRWGLEATGHVVPAEAVTAQHRLELTVNDELRLLVRSGPRGLKIGEALPLLGGQAMTRLHTLPEAMSERYIGWLSLPPVVEARIQQGRPLTVGRLSEAFRSLRPLAAPGFLQALPTETGDRMGLSREHAELTLTADGLNVRGLGQANLVHLGHDMRLLGLVTATQSATLTPGQHLLFSHYVWRFIG